MKNLYWRRTLCSFLLVLLMMPLGHAAMILMEHYLEETALHYCGFAMGFAGLCIVIFGVFVANDTKASIMGLAGALLFWTGWVEFLFSYYAWRYGVHCDLAGSGIVETATEYVNGIGTTHDFTINGVPLNSFAKAELKSLRGSRPEYLIIPATFGMWMMIVLFYAFCTRTGCRFFNFMQKALRISSRIPLRPIVHLPAMVTFMELNVMMWSCYLLLMFCYDPVFLGSSHCITFVVGLGCLIASVFMFAKELRIRQWGANIRMAVATVIVFWTFVEVMARNGILPEIWVDPLRYISELSIMTAVIIAFPIISLMRHWKIFATFAVRFKH